MATKRIFKRGGVSSFPIMMAYIEREILPTQCERKLCVFVCVCVCECDREVQQHHLSVKSVQSE